MARFAGWNTNSDLTLPPTMVTNYINDRASNTLKDLSFYLSTSTNDLQKVRAFEDALKDTVRAAPFAVTRIAVQWPTNALYYTTPSAASLDLATSGSYVYHCHILDHEDNDMMRPFQLLPPYQPRLETLYDPTVNPSGLNHFRIGIATRLNEVYRLESATDLFAADWLELPLADIAGTGALVEIVPPAATNQMRYYRAARLLSP